MQQPAVVSAGGQDLVRIRATKAGVQISVSNPSAGTGMSGHPQVVVRGGGVASLLESSAEELRKASQQESRGGLNSAIESAVQSALQDADAAMMHSGSEANAAASETGQQQS